jgi:hypothetical protein
MDNKGQGMMGAAMVAIVILISIVIVQVVFQAFYVPVGASVGVLNNASGGTLALIQLFGLLIAVGGVLILLRAAF